MNKQTSNDLASQAAAVLNNDNASQTAKKLAGSALAQSKSDKQTGEDLKSLASKVLKNDEDAASQALAGSVLSQSGQ